MRPSLNLFWSFIKLLAHKWILWLFLALDAIAALIQLIIPSFKLPQSVYIGILIIGLVWASFETYLDLLSKIPDKSRPVAPEISIFFVEGSEYEYGLQQGSESFTEKTSPIAQITMHMRIENTGYVDVDLLAISGDIEFNKPYNFLVPYPYRLDGSEFIFPVKLSPKESILVDIIAPIHPLGFLTDTQIAAQTREIIRQKKVAESKMFVEVIDSTGITFQRKINSSVSLVPLCQMYIAYWKKQKRNDLANLAVGGDL